MVESPKGNCRFFEQSLPFFRSPSTLKNYAKLRIFCVSFIEKKNPTAFALCSKNKDLWGENTLIFFPIF